jgi:transglutaminase-like putative cysteine protease
MEVRMQPLDNDRQRCLRFGVTTSPMARVFAYQDHDHNVVHCFDIPAQHTRLEIAIEAAVDVLPAADPPAALPPGAWEALDAATATGEYLDWLLPSPFTTPTEARTAFATEIGAGRGGDPLSTLRALNSRIYAAFAYEPRTTRVDSPIDVALEARAGVCQDFSHIMLALVRRLGMPCRYVSGYIAPDTAHHDRSREDSTHAWIEAWLPDLGWIGFDPTNDSIGGQRRIGVAIGRDYSDVPPTRGVFKGDAGSELSVAVVVTPATSHIATRPLAPAVSWIVPPKAPVTPDVEAQGQQQQQ